MHTTSQECLIKLLIGGSDFSFVIETNVFRLNLSLKSLFRYTFIFVCKPRKSIKRVVCKISFVVMREWEDLGCAAYQIQKMEKGHIE